MEAVHGSVLWQHAQREPEPPIPMFSEEKGNGRKPTPPPPSFNWSKLFVALVSLTFLVASGVLIFVYNPTSLLEQVFCAGLLGAGLGGFASSIHGDVSFKTKDGIVASGAAAMFLIVLSLIFRTLGLVPTSHSESARRSTNLERPVETSVSLIYFPKRQLSLSNARRPPVA